MSIYDAVLTIGYAVSCVIIAKRLRTRYVEPIFNVTTSVLKNFNENISDELTYPDINIREFNDLNRNLQGLRTTLQNATLISYPLNTASIPLVHINDDPQLVTLESFKEYLPQLIYSAQNYRNAIIEVFYDFTDDELTAEEETNLINVLKFKFQDYPSSLIIPNEDKSGIYIFVPHIDSFSRIKEYLTSSMREIAVNKETFDGLTTIIPRYSLVCYPYSNVHELFPDLSYAKRQGQPINFYFPNRLSALSELEIAQNSMNLNNMSRILEALSTLDYTTSKKNESLKAIKDTLSSLATFLSIKTCGVFVRDETSLTYRNLLEVSEKENELFKNKTNINEGFIKALDEVADFDGSYYFSRRSNANYVLAEYIDRINIYSGFYYVIKDRDTVKGIVYFFNKEKDLVFSSYIREAIFVLCKRIGDYLLVSSKEDDFTETFKEVNNILMESDYALYRVDPKTYELVGYSQHFPMLYKGAKYGEKCFKALYGLEGPCKDCPLITKAKKLAEVEGAHYEISLSLNEQKTRLKRLLVHNVQDGTMQSDKFDKDLLINSYSSLVLSLRNSYAIHGRGYLLVLRVDNLDILLKEAGSEGYLYCLRQLISKINDACKSKNNIYYFNPQSIAILLNEVGHIDVVNLCEKIYEISQEEYAFNEMYFRFNLTYLPYSFPQQFPEAEDFLKYTLRHYTNLTIETNKNNIYFPDGDYMRSASRTEFMLSVIEDQFVNKTFSVALQPMVRAGNKSIYGAELLIRLSDTYRNSVFNADELIRVAGQNGKISLISNALLGYVGELYQQFGLTTFKVFGFNRLTINTDYSFFADSQIFTNLYELITTYNLPRDFLGFEITEKDVFQNYERFKSVCKGILNHHIALICDQYSGEYISVEKLKELGFSEIKIGRRLVGDIEVNPKHLNEVKALDEVAKKNNMKITLVGVENSDQYILIRDMDKDCSCQGYHFYRPLDDVHLIEELRKNQ